MLFIYEPNKDFLVPHPCRATIWYEHTLALIHVERQYGMSIRSLFYLFLKLVYINFIFSDNIRIFGSYGIVVVELKK
jgi:hypothetical protein